MSAIPVLSEPGGDKMGTRDHHVKMER